MKEGACESVVVLDRDGRVHQAAKPPNDLGSVAPDELAALDSAIRATDFAALKSHPFTGTCPTAYDGQEIVFQFDTRSGLQRIASCESTSTLVSRSSLLYRARSGQSSRS